MKIIILEGIATSGKTSVKNELEKIFDKQNIKHTFVHEDDVLMSLFKKLSREKTIHNLYSLLTKQIDSSAQIIIFDRFHLTYISNPNESKKEFSKIYNLLNKEGALTCVLKIPENKIEERISMAMSHRDPNWSIHIMKKGENMKEVISWYRKSQRDLIKKVKEIPLAYKIFDTGNLDFHKVAIKVVKIIKESVKSY